MKRWQRKPLLPDTRPYYLHYKEPLTGIEDGYGYLGVVTTNEKQTHIQCHICGYYFYHLGAHVRQAHKISARDYKIKFGLYLSRSLLSQKAREEQASRAKENWSKKDQLEHLERIRDQKPVEGERPETNPMPLERKNAEGRCDDQLLEKIRKTAHRRSKRPTRQDFMQEYPGYLHSVRTTFGSWNNALRLAGFEPKRNGRQKMMSDRQIIEAVRGFTRTHGREPTWADFNNEDMLPSTRVAQTRFGGVKKLRQRARGTTIPVTFLD